jgi:hypothetical protein
MSRLNPGVLETCVWVGLSYPDTLRRVQALNRQSCWPHCPSILRTAPASVTRASSRPARAPPSALT